MYKYISSMMKHDAIPHTVTFGSSVATSEYEKVNLFNKLFHSVFTQSSFNIPPLDQLPQPQSTLSDITITECDVHEGLISLNPVKAMGIDSIGPKILKHHSTMQQLLVFLESIYKSLGSNAQTDIIYLDFKNAFDSVAHGELLVKLWSFGITGSLWK